MAAYRHEARLDAAAALVLDTRELGRRPGSMRLVQREVRAPRRIGLDLVAVPADAALTLDLRMESVMEGVLITGAVFGIAEGECSRCLEPLHESVSVHLTELYAYPNSATETTTDADEFRSVVADLIDLEEAVIDAVALALPLQPLCSPECLGLCPTCGVPLAIAGTGHGHETIDPRWAVLATSMQSAVLTEATAITEPTGESEPSSTVASRTDHGAPTDVEEK